MKANLRLLHRFFQVDSGMAVETFPIPKRILYITSGSNAGLHYPEATQNDKLLTLSYEALTAAALVDFVPGLVVFSLFGGATDATEILTALNGLGYCGRCLVLTQSLPRLKSIEAELRNYAGEIQVELMIRP
jgi:hypothetical protein